MAAAVAKAGCEGAREGGAGRSVSRRPGHFLTEGATTGGCVLATGARAAGGLAVITGGLAGVSSSFNWANSCSRRSCRSVRTAMLSPADLTRPTSQTARASGTPIKSTTTISIGDFFPARAAIWCQAYCDAASKVLASGNMESCRPSREARQFFPHFCIYCVFLAFLADYGKKEAGGGSPAAAIAVRYLPARVQNRTYGSDRTDRTDGSAGAAATSLLEVYSAMLASCAA